MPFKIHLIVKTNLNFSIAAIYKMLCKYCMYSLSCLSDAFSIIFNMNISKGKERIGMHWEQGLVTIPKSKAEHFVVLYPSFKKNLISFKAILISTALIHSICEFNRCQIYPTLTRRSSSFYSWLVLHRNEFQITHN